MNDARKNPKGARGFTVLELMNTLAIFSIVAATATMHLEPRRMQINAAHRSIIACLRVARSKAITRSVHYLVEFPRASEIKVSRMKLVLGAWQVDSTDSKSIMLPSAVQFSTVLVGTSIEYNGRGMPVNINGPMQIDVLDEFGGITSAQVWPSGQINEL